MGFASNLFNIIQGKNRRIWKTYQNDYVMLNNDIKFYQTGWKVEDIDIAKAQMLGAYYRVNDVFLNFAKSEFHVYYIDKKPHIIIRNMTVNGKNEIVEISGIADSQTVEEELDQIVLQKLTEIRTKDINMPMKKVKCTRELTRLYKKYQNNEEFSSNDIMFLYEIYDSIDTFISSFSDNDLNKKDPRIETIISSRNKINDYNAIKELEMKINFLLSNKDIISEINFTEELALALLKKDYNVFSYMEFQTPNICKFVVQQNGYMLKYVKEQTKELCELAVSKNFECICYIKDKKLKDKLSEKYELIKKKERLLSHRTELLSNESSPILDCELDYASNMFYANSVYDLLSDSDSLDDTSDNFYKYSGHEVELLSNVDSLFLSDTSDNFSENLQI